MLLASPYSQVIAFFGTKLHIQFSRQSQNIADSDSDEQYSIYKQVDNNMAFQANGRRFEVENAHRIILPVFSFNQTQSILDTQLARGIQSGTDDNIVKKNWVCWYAGRYTYADGNIPTKTWVLPD